MAFIKRPVVLLSLISITEILIVLSAPSFFGLVLCFSIISACIFFILYFRKKQLATAFVFSFIILFSAVNPYFSFINGEKRVEGLVSEYKKDKNNVYCATVISADSYGQYSTIYAKLESVNSVYVKEKPNIRLGSFSGTVLNDGDKIIFTGTPRLLSEIEEDVFDTSSHLRSKYVFMDFPSASIVSSSKGKASFWETLRSYSKNTIYTHLPDSHNFETSAVTYAMFAGDQGYIPENLNDAFRDSGTTHVICVSGMHLTIIIGALYMFLSFLTIHKNLKCALVILLAIFYTAFTGFTLATIRACIMCCFTFTALILGKKEDAYQSLFGSMLLICSFSPYSIFDISLILSFSATYGILVFSEIRKKKDIQNQFFKVLSSFLDTFISNIGAVLFTLPICAYSFGGITVLSPVATLIISIPCNMLLVFSLILIMISPLSSVSFLMPMVEFVASVCDKISAFMIYTAEFFSSFRYAGVTAKYSGIYLLLFICTIVVLTLFLAFDIKRARFFCCMLIITSGVAFSFTALNFGMFDDSAYKVSYYRKNENDRQLSIKLGTEGYLIVNADSILCTDKSEKLFDFRDGKNYLLVIPDENISSAILADNIRSFDNRFGIKKVFVPNTNEGALLANELILNRISCEIMPIKSVFGDINLIYDSNSEREYISVYDGDTRTTVVFSDCYDKEYFDGTSDICAFFTRKTLNQFSPQIDTKPNCEIFFTRMKKDDTVYGVVNTYSKKSFSIKG